MKRYDPYFEETIFKQGKKDWIHIRMVNRDNPCPDMKTLNNMGNLIRDCAVHEINLALKFKNELPISVFAEG